MNPYDVYQAGIDGLQAGREQGTQSRLARLVSQGMTAQPDQRQGLLAQIAQSSPQAALDTRKMFRDMDQDGVSDLATTANQFLSIQSMGDEAATQQAYANLAAKARAVTGAPIPDKFDQRYLAGIQKMAGVGASEGYTLAPGSRRYDASGQLIAEAPFAPQRQDYSLYEGADGLAWIPKPSGDTTPQGGQRMPATAGGSMPAPTSGAGAVLFDDALKGVLGREGGYVANDAGAGPTNFGINSRANPDVNVATLDKEGAARIYRERYWDAIDADNLPPAIREAAFDTAVNQGPEVAKRLIQQSGGDPQKFAALRQQHYDSLVQSNPGKYGQYAESWRNRNQATAGQPSSGGVNAIPIAGVRPKPKDQGNVSAGYRPKADGSGDWETIPGGPADRKNNPTAADQAKGEMAMRKELTDLTKDDRTVASAFSKVEAAANNPSAQNDLALIFAYMKMLDPGSVVREGEFANAQNAAGIPDRVLNAYNKALRGERLNDSQRSSFVSSARDIFNTTRMHQIQNTRQYAEMAEDYGYDPVRSTGTREASPQFRQQFDKAGDLLKDARAAIAAGKDPAAVRQRLVEMGFGNIAGRL